MARLVVLTAKDHFKRVQLSHSAPQLGSHFGGWVLVGSSAEPLQAAFHGSPRPSHR